MADAVARAGADLVLWGRNTSAVARRATRLRLLGRRVLAQRVDVTQPSAIRRAVREALRQCGRLDVLINNAGIWDGDAARRMSRRMWDRVIAADLTSVLQVSQAVWPSMRERRYGKIINLASTSGLIAHAEGAAYGSAKAALIHLTRILAMEWGPDGIRVNAIAPGVFRTDMTRDLWTDRRWMAAHRRASPLERIGEPEDIGGLAVFLASPASDYITGQTVVIDGGFTLGRAA